MHSFPGSRWNQEFKNKPRDPDDAHFHGWFINQYYLSSAGCVTRRRSDEFEA